MQRFTLLLKELNATSQTQTSNLELVDEYYVYRQQNGGGIVDEFNVKVYLDDPDNAEISQSFFRYLTGNTNTSQFKEIFYDDKKLSNLFNKFYNSSVLTNLSTPTSIINNELTGTTTIDALQYYKQWDGNNISYSILNGIPLSIENSSNITTSREKLITITEEDSYYIEVDLKENKNLINQINFSEYSKDYYQSIQVQKKARWGEELTIPMLDFIKKVRPDINITYGGNNNEIRKWYDVYGKRALPWGTITIDQIILSDTTINTTRPFSYAGDLTQKMIQFIRKVKPNISSIFPSDGDLKNWFDHIGHSELPWGNISLHDIVSADSPTENNLIKQSFVDINIKDDFLENLSNSFRNPDDIEPLGSGLLLTFYTNRELDFIPPMSSLQLPKRLIVQEVSLSGWSRDFGSNFLLRFTGYIYIASPGIYTFKLNSNEGSIMYLGDLLLIDNDGIHNADSKEASIGLFPGLHKIDIRYFERAGNELLEFSYKLNNEQFQTNAIWYH